MTDNGDTDDIVAAGDISSFIREKSGAFRVKFATGSTVTNPAAIKKFALFRLGKDLKECRDHPLPMIAAEPLDEETNLWEWHANLMGPQGSSYEDICFHFIMKFPQNYPAAPPKIEICSRFEHPNVFGRWICLDMLQGQWIPDDDTQTTKDIGTGWTPAYSVQSILVQLQAFLFDSVDTTYWSKLSEKYGFASTTQRARQSAKDFICKRSSHTGRKPWPEPLAWKDRLRYIVPGKEMPDIAKIKQEFWNFLETIQDLVVQNKWPRICPLEAGSFFSWSLLPWYQLSYVSLTVLLKESGSKSMHKKHVKVVRGLINKCYKYLNKRPRPPPNKGVMLSLMYRIESALDIAVNNTYSTNNKLRERGYWQWKIKDSDLGNIQSDEKENPNQEGQTEQEEEKVNEWKDFPLNISQQIEALYCRWQSDLRRPDQLVEIITDSSKVYRQQQQKSSKKTLKKSGEKDQKNKKNQNQKKKGDKKNKKNDKKEKDENKQDLENNLFSNGRKYGIITKPKGYHWHVLGRKDLSEDEKKTKYVPYSKEEKCVRVMVIDPLRTKQEKVSYWMNGPHYVTGKTTYSKYKLESSKSNKVKFTPYIWKRTMILDRFHDDYGRWFLCVHPMPTRRDINKNSELVPVEKLKIRSEGTYYKAYVKGDDEKHYVINVAKGRCRCIEDQKVYKIRRTMKQRTTEQLWNEILKQAGNEGDIPWKAKKREIVKVWPWNKYEHVVDPLKYVGKCGFIDLSMDYFEESDEDNEGVTSGGDNNTKKGNMTKNDAKFVIESISKCPQLDQKVNGRIVKISRQGMSVDIGYKVNGKPVHAYLDLSQIKCPQHIISKRLEQYLRQKKEEEIEQQEYEQYLKREMKKKKKKRKKKAQQNKKDGTKTQQTTKQPQNDEEKETKREPPVKKVGKFSLPRSCFNMSQFGVKSGDILQDLYVYDVDSAVNEISLSMFMPLSLLSTGDRISGTVRSVLPYAAFVDVGAESDAFLHRTALEDAYCDRIIFDCSNNVQVGQKLDLVVTNSDVENAKLEVSIYHDTAATNKEPNRLVLPDDFDESRAVYHSIFGLLCDDIADLVFQFVDRGDLHRLRKVCMLFERIVDNKSNLRFEIEELKCFHSKQKFRDCILGFGVKVVRYPKSSMICDIYPFLDLLSAKSFNAYTVRMSVWKQPFSHWLPVYINKEHGSRSLLWAKRMITEIVNDPKYAKEYKDWNPYYVLKIIPTLMNTMIVKIMKGDLHESIVALEGYTMFYHLLLAFIGEYPFLQTFIDRNLGEFNQKNANNVYRDKKHVKSLGEWIALLATSNKYCWKDVATSYLRECFDRNAKWILTANKALLSEQIPKRQRLTKSFNACQVSLKLCMFHVVFLRMFRYSERSGTFLPVQDVKEKLDKLYGRPTYKMREVLQRNVKRIKKIKNWKQFFDGIHIKCPSDNELYDWLIESMRNSEEKRYHKRYWFMKKRKKADPDAGLFDKFDDAGDEWSAKQFGSDVQSAQGSKKKKMSTADQMMAAF